MNTVFISLEDENEKACNKFIEDSEIINDNNYSGDAILVKIGFLGGCNYKDNIYFSMSATQCVHQEALDVEEGFDGVICRKHLKVLALENTNKDKSVYIFQLKQHIDKLEERIETQGKNLAHYTNLQVDLEHKLKKAEERRDWLQGEMNKMTDYLEANNLLDYKGKI